MGGRAARRMRARSAHQACGVTPQAGGEAEQSRTHLTCVRAAERRAMAGAAGVSTASAYRHGWQVRCLVERKNVAGGGGWAGNQNNRGPARALPGPELALRSARGATRAQGRSCKARDGLSTDPTAAERSREASTGRAQAWLARCASEAEHGRRERAKGRHGAASGARLAGPKAHASRVTRAVRSRIENGVRGARRTAHGAHRHSTERQAARARADGRGPCRAKPKQGP